MCKKARDFGGPGIFTLKLWVVLFVLLLNLLVSYSWQVAAVANTHVVE